MATNKTKTRTSVPLHPLIDHRVNQLAAKWDRSKAYVIAKLVGIALDSNELTLNAGETNAIAKKGR